MSELKIAVGGILMAIGVLFGLAALFIVLASIFFYALSGGVDLAAIDAAWKLGLISLPFFAINRWAWSK